MPCYRPRFLVFALLPSLLVSVRLFIVRILEEYPLPPSSIAGPFRLLRLHLCLTTSRLSIMLCFSLSPSVYLLRRLSCLRMKR